MTPAPDTAAVATDDVRPARNIGDRLANFVPLPARRLSLAYSRFVLSMKIALPAAAVGLLLLVALWSQFQGGEHRFALPKVVLKPDDLENLRMESPRFVGLDSRNQPFLVTARLATQVSPGGPVTELDEPKGDITLANGTWISMEAERGLYDHRAESLLLTEGVTVFQDRGYQLQTRSARFMFRPGDAQGDEPVKGQGHDFELSGEGFRIENKGARLHLTGESRILFHPRRANEATAPARGRP